MGEGIRHNKGKVQFSMLDMGVLGDTARVFQDAFETGRYPKYNWKKGMPLVAVSDSLRRHIAAWLEGEDIDPDDGLPHLDKIASNAHILQYNAKHHPDCDDREKKLTKVELEIGLNDKDLTPKIETFHTLSKPAWNLLLKLPVDIMNQWLHNYEGATLNTDSLLELISSGFTWDESKEGHDYWNKIMDEYEED